EDEPRPPPEVAPLLGRVLPRQEGDVLWLKGENLLEGVVVLEDQRLCRREYDDLTVRVLLEPEPRNEERYQRLPKPGRQDDEGVRLRGGLGNLLLVLSGLEGA